MTNPSRAKGTAWESALLPLIRRVWPEANRAPLWGAADRGDFTGTGPFCIEAKAHKTLDLAGFMDQAVAEAGSAGVDWPVVFVKRRGKSPARGYAVMEVETFLTLLDYWGAPEIGGALLAQEDDR